MFSILTAVAYNYQHADEQLCQYVSCDRGQHDSQSVVPPYLRIYRHPLRRHLHVLRKDVEVRVKQRLTFADAILRLYNNSGKKVHGSGDSRIKQDWCLSFKPSNMFNGSQMSNQPSCLFMSIVTSTRVVTVLRTSKLCPILLIYTPIQQTLNFKML